MFDLFAQVKEILEGIKEFLKKSEKITINMNFDNYAIIIEECLIKLNK